MGLFDSLFGKKKDAAPIKKTCPVCGAEFSDKGMDVSDGTICLSCWEAVMDDFESGKMDEQDDFFIAPIRVAVNTKKAGQDTIRRAKAKKPEACPLCGGKMPKLMTPEAKDGYICDDCFGKFIDLEERKETEKALADMTISELSALFSLEEKRQAAKQLRMEQDVCPVCGGDVSEKSTGSLWGDIKKSVKDGFPPFVVLKDNRKICVECADKVRASYPVAHSRKPDGDGGYEDVYTDPLNEITLEEFKKALADADIKQRQPKDEFE